MIKKGEHLKLCTTIRQLEEQSTQLRRQFNEPSPSSLLIPFKVDPPCSADFQDNCALNNAQMSKPSITIILKRASSTSSKPRLPDEPRVPTATLPTSSPSSSELETLVQQLEEEIAKARNCRETIISTYRSQFTFIFDRFQALQSGGTDTILWKLTILKLVFDTAKSSARLDNAAKDPSTHYNSPLYHTHPYGYNFFVQFNPYGLDVAAGNHASLMFALFHGDNAGLLTWLFPKTIHLSVRDQIDPQNKWTITFARREKISFRRPTREPCPTLTNFNFFHKARYVQ